PAAAPGTGARDAEAGCAGPLPGGGPGGFPAFGSEGWDIGGPYGSG
ncbi:hypothetical protein STIAU_4890, partial [Stigmatella aurantiaca DW4/3-1]